MSSLKNELSKVSRNLDKAKDSYRLEYVKSEMGASAFHLQLRKNNLVSIIREYCQISQKILSMEKNNWVKKEVQKISKIATLDMNQLKMTGRIDEVFDIKKQIESFRDNIVKVILLREEFKISFNSIKGLVYRSPFVKLSLS